MDSSRLPPETPRRQLLKRIHRRSSILPSMDPSSHLATSTSTSTTRSSSRCTSLNPDNASPLLGNAALEKHDEAEEDYEPTNYGSEKPHLNNHNQPNEDNNTGTEYYNEEEEFGDGNGEEAAWAQVDELMDTVQLKNQRILELEKSVSQLQRDLQTERERAKPSKSSNAGSSEGGLTRAAAVKLEREFLSQEMILKGLQRDNEDKTLEVEALRRKVKVMSDFLARQYGADDWEAVVSAASGTAVGASTSKDSGNNASVASPEEEPPSAVARVLSAVNAGSPRASNKAKFIPMLGSGTDMNPFSPAASSPTKALNNDDVLIPTIARLQTPASSPSKLFVSSFAPRRTSMDNADISVDQGDEEEEDADREPSPLAMPDGLGSKPTTKAASALPAGVDPNVLLASIESVRLLIQGFERKNAMRRAELESTIDKAIEAERRAERLQTSAASAVTPSLETPSITAS